VGAPSSKLFTGGINVCTGGISNYFTISLQ
jgi:hypothetical protein